MSISDAISFYLIRIKLGHAGGMGDEDLLSHVTPIESLFDSNKFIMLKLEELPLLI